jgi:hypothetical protein
MSALVFYLLLNCITLRKSSKHVYLRIVEFLFYIKKGSGQSLPKTLLGKYRVDVSVSVLYSSLTDTHPVFVVKDYLTHIFLQVFFASKCPKSIKKYIPFNSTE